MNPDAQNFWFCWVTGRRTFAAVLVRQTGSLEASVASTAAQNESCFWDRLPATWERPTAKQIELLISDFGELNWWGWVQELLTCNVLENLHENTVGFNFQHLKTSCSVFSVCFFAVPWAWGAPALQRAIAKSPTPLRKASATVYTYTCFWSA